MAEANKNIEEILKPFYERAFETQDRLEKLEASITTKRNSDNEESIKTIDDLRSELKNVKVDQESERDKAQKELQMLVSENARLRYRVKHLVRALNEANSNSNSNSNSTSKID